MRGTVANAGIVIAWACSCGGGGGGPDGAGSGDGGGIDAEGGGRVLSDDYPGDVGLGADPAVVWFEPFNGATIAAVTGRYNAHQGDARMALVTDQPPGAGGMHALAMTAGNGVAAVDLFKHTTHHDEWW